MKWLWTALVALAIATVGSVLAAANVVPDTKAGGVVASIDSNALKPTQCTFLTLTATVTGSGTFQGGAASELILGSPGADTIRGQGGNDCILGGDGNDSLRGDGGFDICIGGAGTDTFNCEFPIDP